MAGGAEPREDIVARIDGLVDEHARRWQAEHEYGIVSALSGGLHTSADGRVRTVRARLPDLAHERLTFADLAGLLPDAVKARLRAIVSTADYRAGAPLTERQRLLDEIDDRLDRLEMQHARLVDEARGAGIEMPYFPRVQARLDSELARAAREAVERQQRADLEALAEQAAKAAAAPRAVRSGYIASDGATMATRREV